MKIKMLAIAAAAAIAFLTPSIASADQRTSIAITQNSGVGLSYDVFKFTPLSAGPVVTVQTQGAHVNQTKVNVGAEAQLLITNRIAIGVSDFIKKGVKNPSFTNPEITLNIRL